MPVVPFVLFAVLGTFTPGPNNIMSMNRARRFGMKGAWPFIYGAGTGFFLVMLACALFNRALGEIIPGVQWFLGILGALYLLYLAAKPFFPSGKKRAPDPSEGRAYVTGVLLQFVNPKVILHGIAVMSGFILPYFDSTLSLTLFSLGMALTGSLSMACWALFGTVFQKYFSEHELAVNIVMAILLVYCAAVISGIGMN